MRTLSKLISVLTAAALSLSCSNALAGNEQAKDESWDARQTCEDGELCNGEGLTEHDPGYAHNPVQDGEVVNWNYEPNPIAVVRGNGSGAFITQIGEDNAGIIRQSRSIQYARIDQDGARNTASIAQGGTGAHHVRIKQDGADNVASATQDGEGDQVAYMIQTGFENVMTVTQRGGLSSSGVEALQMGNGNDISLTQNGENNMARLVQEGSDNSMTAVQNGDNQLTWTQTGVGLSDLHITQPAGQALLVHQTR